jgi:hypothetical protein
MALNGTENPGGAQRVSQRSRDELRPNLSSSDYRVMAEAAQTSICPFSKLAPLPIYTINRICEVAFARPSGKTDPGGVVQVIQYLELAIRRKLSLGTTDEALQPRPAKPASS